MMTKKYTVAFWACLSVIYQAASICEELSSEADTVLSLRKTPDVYRSGLILHPFGCHCQKKRRTWFLQPAVFVWLVQLVQVQWKVRWKEGLYTWQCVWRRFGHLISNARKKSAGRSLSCDTQVKLIPRSQIALFRFLYPKLFKYTVVCRTTPNFHQGQRLVPASPRGQCVSSSKLLGFVIWWIHLQSAGFLHLFWLFQAPVWLSNGYKKALGCT